MALTVRPATAADPERLLAIHVGAFPDSRSGTVRLRAFERNGYGSLADLRVVEDDGGRLVAHAFLFSLSVFYAGRAVPTAGVASVGVAPEARGRGVAALLLAALEQEARARGDVLAMLYPFRQGFYQRLGYGVTTPSVHLDASPAGVPEAWVRAAREAPLRAATGEDRPALEACLERYAMRCTGLFRRPEALWERRHLDERRHTIVLPGEAARGEATVRGYVAFRHEQREAHAAVGLAVDELVADDDDARRLLVGALGAQRDQVRSFRWLVPEGDPMLVGLDDADRHREGTETVEHPLGVLAAGPMVKILELSRALAARPAPALPLSIDAGVGAPHTWGAREGDARAVRVAPPALASLLFGGVDAAVAARLGWLDAAPDAVSALTSALSGPPFSVIDTF